MFSDGAAGTMAEVGLLSFARVALQVATQVLPPYRTRFSKHQFTQPQLLAVLCLMRYEDWTFREERPGELVTREDLHQALWSSDTFVDFDHGLNNAIKRIRDVLNDSVDAPLFIETLPRLGYRFIGQKNENGSRARPATASDPTSVVNEPNLIDSKRVLPQESRWRQFSMLALAGALTLVFTLAGYFGWRRTHAVRPSNSGHLMLAVLPSKILAETRTKIISATDSPKKSLRNSEH